MKINVDEFAEIASKIAKRAAVAEPAEKAKLVDHLEELRTAAEKADAEGSSDIEVDIKKFESVTVDIVEAAERTATGGIAINVEDITKAELAKKENHLKGLDADGFPDDMNDPAYRKGEPTERAFGSDPWLQK